MGTSSKRSALAGALLSILLTAGCAPESGLRSDVGATDYLRGVETKWSVPLDRLGDAEQLDADSSMRHALVAGDASFYVAASGFRVDDVIALDLIAVNHRQQEVHLRSSDIHLIDASGRQLPARASAPRAAARGLQGRGSATTPPSTLFQDFGREDPSPDFTMAQTPGGFSAGSKPMAVSEARRARPLPPTSNSGLETGQTEAYPSVTSVRIGSDEGRAFWAYFDEAGATFPVTAWITLENGEQLRYEFAR